MEPARKAAVDEPPMKAFIEKYFNLLTIVFGVLLVGAFALLKLL